MTSNNPSFASFYCARCGASGYSRDHDAPAPTPAVLEQARHEAAERERLSLIAAFGQPSEPDSAPAEGEPRVDDANRDGLLAAPNKSDLQVPVAASTSQTSRNNAKGHEKLARAKSVTKSGRGGRRSCDGGNRGGGAEPKLKGSGFECEVEQFLQDCGIAAEKVPLSGAVKRGRFDHDINCPVRGINRRIECKRRRRAFRTIDTMLDSNFAVIVRDDRSRPLVVMTLATFAELAIDQKPNPFSALIDMIGASRLRHEPKK
jgi:hypothetical protein